MLLRCRAVDSAVLLRYCVTALLRCLWRMRLRAKLLSDEPAEAVLDFGVPGNRSYPPIVWVGVEVVAFSVAL